MLTEAQDYRKEAESTIEIVHEGVNVFATRIPVKSWTGYLALYGPGGAFVCNSTPGVALASSKAAPRLVKRATSKARSTRACR